MNNNAMEHTIKDCYSMYINPGFTAMLDMAGINIVEEKSDGCYIYTVNGEKYIDCIGGYGAFALGHRPRQVVRAVCRQMLRQPQSSHVFYNPVQAKAAELLAKLLELESCGSFFVNSGAEAVEGALKLARAYTGRKKIVAMENSFHGKTAGALSVTGRREYRRPFEPLLPEVIHIPFDDLSAAEKAIDTSVAAVIVEAVQGEGGIIVPQDGYLRALADICRQNGVLLIADEVQCGFGRTGLLFGYQYEGIKPDIIALAKALGGGVMPVGAFVARQEIWQPFIDNPVLHTSTFGGNQLACAAAAATIKIFSSSYESFAVTEKGQQFRRGLEQLKLKYPGFIKAVRGRGLMIGVEFTEAKFALGFMKLCLKCHILTAYTLNNPAVIRLEPPLIINAELITEIIERIDVGLVRLFSK